MWFVGSAIVVKSAKLSICSSVIVLSQWFQSFLNQCSAYIFDWTFESDVRFYESVCLWLMKNFIVTRSNIVINLTPSADSAFF